MWTFGGATGVLHSNIIPYEAERNFLKDSRMWGNKKKILCPENECI